MKLSRIPAKPAKAATRILGPYQDGSRWRVVQFVDGKRTSRTATTREKALQIKATLRPPSAPPRPTLGAALREYDSHLRFGRRQATATCEHAQRTLSAFLGGSADEPITSLTSLKARKLARFEHPQAQRIRRRYAVNTRYTVLGHAFRFFDWAKSHRYVERNPFDGVRPVGLLGPGPAPLTLERARTLAAVTLHGAANDPGALGALLILVMGLRSGQVLSLRVADVDLDQRRLKISIAADRSRTVLIPDLLLPCLRAAQTGKLPDALLIGPGRTGKVRPHNFLWRAVQRLCKQAGVTSTCPRSLRKLHFQLVQTATRASDRTSSGAAARIPSPPTPHALVLNGDTAHSVRVVDLLGLSLSTTAPRLDALLSVLTAEQLAQLRPLLDHQRAA